MPRVSVVMTAYNGSAYLADTVASILGQSYRDLEFVIVDDCSTDGTFELLQGLKDPRVRLYRNETNQGISLSRNRAFELAEGEFIAATDQDDVSLPSRLERQVHYLDEHPDVVMVSSAVDFLTEHGRRVDPSVVKTDPVSLRIALFFGRHNVTYSSLCIRRDVQRRAALVFRPEYHYAEDYELYHRIAEAGPIATLPETLVLYRYHEANNSRVHYEEMTANGCRFLGRAYGQLLGRTLEDGEPRRIWQMFVEGRPAADLAELRWAATLLIDAQRAFLRVFADRDAAPLVRAELAMVWWDIVQSATATLGRQALAQWQRYPELDSWRPPLTLRLRTLIKAGLVDYGPAHLLRRAS